MSRQVVRPMASRPQLLVHVSVAVLREESVLMVREMKPDVLDRWNLPGGHAERGESILAAAQRELREETGLVLPLESLIGIYSGPSSVRFAFAARDLGSEQPHAGDEISAVQYVPLEELSNWPTRDLVSAPMLQLIIDDVRNGSTYPIAAFRHVLQPPDVRAPA